MKIKSFKTIIPCFDPKLNGMRQRWDSLEYDLSLHTNGIWVSEANPETPNEVHSWLIPWHMIEGTIDVGTHPPKDLQASPARNIEGAPGAGGEVIPKKGGLKAFRGGSRDS